MSLFKLLMKPKNNIFVYADGEPLLSVTLCTIEVLFCSRWEQRDVSLVTKAHCLVLAVTLI